MKVSRLFWTVWVLVLVAGLAGGQWTNAPAPGGGSGVPGPPADTAASLYTAISNEATIRAAADASLSNTISGLTVGSTDAAARASIVLVGAVATNAQLVASNAYNLAANAATGAPLYALTLTTAGTITGSVAGGSLWLTGATAGASADLSALSNGVLAVGAVASNALPLSGGTVNGEVYFNGTNPQPGEQVSITDGSIVALLFISENNNASIGNNGISGNGQGITNVLISGLRITNTISGPQALYSADGTNGYWATPAGGAGGSQTPWTSNVDAANFDLTNFHALVANSGCQIVGGNTNSAVLGGRSNRINSVSADFSSIVGGDNNLIVSTAVGNFIGGGTNNQISGSTSGGAIGGGANHKLTGNYSFIGGGDANQIGDGGYSSILGGRQGTIYSSSGYNAILGGYQPLITNNAASSTINLLFGDRVVNDTRAGAASFNVLLGQRASVGTNSGCFVFAAPTHALANGSAVEFRPPPGVSNAAMFRVNGGFFALADGASGASTALWYVAGMRIVTNANTSLYTPGWVGSQLLDVGSNRIYYAVEATTNGWKGVNLQ